MENSKITFRPKGGLYLFAIITIYVFLLLLFTVFPISTIYLKKYIDSKKLILKYLILKI